MCSYFVRENVSEKIAHSFLHRVEKLFNFYCAISLPSWQSVERNKQYKDLSNGK